MNDSSPNTILLVDDDTILRRMFHMALESAGFRVRDADNGRTAQDRFREERPDLLVSDLHMPVMDGLQLVQWVRLQEGGDLPILVLTSMATQEAGKEALALGANQVVVKPVDLKTFISIIRDLITP